MDKHDRPYKCTALGCEKLPGFTYSGGLLRHEREVHGQHGGPKISFHCPHINCKRHTGKGFSRQENLNEHLRRVHTQNGVALNGGMGSSPPADAVTALERETDDGESGRAASPRASLKRKRDDRDDAAAEIDFLRQEIGRITAENADLRRLVQAQGEESTIMRGEIEELKQSAVRPGPELAHAPMASAPML